MQVGWGIVAHYNLHQNVKRWEDNPAWVTVIDQQMCVRWHYRWSEIVRVLGMITAHIMVPVQFG